MTEIVNPSNEIRPTNAFPSQPISKPSRVPRAFLRFFFYHLYTDLAWAYDLVAWITSAGQWRTWQQAALDTLPNGRLLEIGHGPGHLLKQLSEDRKSVFGLDPSSQMNHLAARRLKIYRQSANLMRARAQALPLPSESFNAIIATFPDEYILLPLTFTEIWRVLCDNGRFVAVLGVAKITGQNSIRQPLTHFFDRFSDWLYRVTGQSVGINPEIFESWIHSLTRRGFNARVEYVRQDRAVVVRLVADKIHRY